MTNQPHIGVHRDDVSDREVAEYLRQHPEFFVTHEALLENLAVPSQNGTVVALAQRQVEVLRNKNRQLKQKLDTLIRIGQDNDALHSNLQRLTLNLLEAVSFEGTLTALYASLVGDFKVDVCSIDLFTERGRWDLTTAHPDGMPVRKISAEDPGLEPFRHMFAKGTVLCGRITPDQSGYLFPQLPEAIESAAVIPLKIDVDSQGAAIGMLAVGSHDQRRFRPDMSTVFLNYMAGFVARKLLLCQS